MTTFLVRLWNKISSKRAALSIMIIGLDDSGKTSILSTLISSTTTTIGKPIRGQQSSSSKHGDTTGATSVGVDSTQASNQLMGLIQTLDVADNKNGRDKDVSPTVGYNYERIQYKDQIVNLLDFSGQSKYRSLWQEFYNYVDGIVFVIDSSDLIRFVVVQDEIETLLSHPYFATISPKTTTSQPSQAEGNTTVTTTSNNDNSSSRAQLMSHQLAQKQVTISQGKLVQSLLIDRPNTQSQTLSSSNQARVLRTKIPILFLANKTDLASSVDVKAICEALNLDQVPKDIHPWLIKATSVRTKQGIIEGFDWLLAEILATSSP